MKFSFEIIIDAPVKKVWNLIYQLKCWHEWIPSIKKIDLITPGPVQKGSKLKVKAKLSFLNLNLPLQVIELQKEKAVVMQGKSLCTSIKRFYYLKPENNKTRIIIGGETSGLFKSFGAKKGLIISKEIAFAIKNKIQATKNQ